MPDLTQLFEDLRGGEYVEALRALALITDAQGGYLSCGGCPKPAEYIGMQRCGAPGGALCAECIDRHKAWIKTATDVADAEPYCRHCDQDVDMNHLYVVGLWDGTERAL